MKTERQRDRHPHHASTCSHTHKHHSTHRTHTHTHTHTQRQTRQRRRTLYGDCGGGLGGEFPGLLELFAAASGEPPLAFFLGSGCFGLLDI